MFASLDECSALPKQQKIMAKQKAPSQTDVLITILNFNYIVPEPLRNEMMGD